MKIEIANVTTIMIKTFKLNILPPYSWKLRGCWQQKKTKFQHFKAMQISISILNLINQLVWIEAQHPGQLIYHTGPMVICFRGAQKNFSGKISMPKCRNGEKISICPFTLVGPNCACVSGECV